MGVDHLVLDPPLEHIFDILDRAYKVLFKLVLKLGSNGGKK
jgi:hypothetical protein